MAVYIDADSLVVAPTPAEQLDALFEAIAAEYKDVVRVESLQRPHVLGRLRAGAGVTVVCGPTMVPYWKGVSHEVRLVVEPDGTEIKDRTAGMLWALEATGTFGTAARKLAEGGNIEHEAYKAAEMFLRTQATYDTEPEVDFDIPIEILKEDAALEVLAGFIETKDRYSDDNPLTLDFEWNKRTSALVGMSVTAHGRLQGIPYEKHIYIPVRAKDYRAPAGFDAKLRSAVEAIHDAGVVTLYHNAKSDLNTALSFQGLDPMRFFGSPIHDSIVMAYVAGFNRVGAKELTRELLKRDALDYPGELEDLPVALAARYAAGGDTRNTYDLYQYLRKLLVRQEQWQVYNEIERPIVPLVASMEWGGMPVAVAELYRLQREYQLTLDGLAQHVWAKHRLNLWSDKDQLEFATRMLGYNPGSVSTDKLATKSEDEWLDTLIGFRKLRHRKRAFVDKHIERWRKAGYPEDFRGYSTFNQAGSKDERDERSFKSAAKTGRFTSKSVVIDGEDVGFGNFQNQPGDIRDAFIAPDGCVVFAYDWKALEMRIGAAMSGDPALLKVMTEVCPDPGEDGECPHEPAHGDPHGQFQYMALEISGVKPTRTVAKNWNFGGQYNAGTDTQLKTLAKNRVFIPYEIGEQLQDARQKAYATYYEYNSGEQEASVERGYSVTYYGRRRYDADLRSGDAKALGHAKRAAGNMPIQGTAADHVKIMMGKFAAVLIKYKAHLAGQVHDELFGWVPKSVAEEFDREAKAVLGSGVIKGLPLLVSGGTGQSWGEVKAA